MPPVLQPQDLRQRAEVHEPGRGQRFGARACGAGQRSLGEEPRGEEGRDREGGREGGYADEEGISASRQTGSGRPQEASLLRRQSILVYSTPTHVCCGPGCFGAMKNVTKGV